MNQMSSVPAGAAVAGFAERLARQRYRRAWQLLRQHDAQLGPLSEWKEKRLHRGLVQLEDEYGWSSDVLQRLRKAATES